MVYKEIQQYGTMHRLEIKSILTTSKISKLLCYNFFKHMTTPIFKHAFKSETTVTEFDTNVKDAF